MWLSIHMIVHGTAACSCRHVMNVGLISTANLHLRMECQGRSSVRYTKLVTITQNLDLKVDDGTTAESALFDELVTVHGDINIEVIDDSRLTDLSFPKLKIVHGDLTLRVYDDSRISTLAFPELQRVHGDFKVIVHDESRIGELRFPLLQQLSLFDIMVSSCSRSDDVVLGKETNSE